MRVYYIYILYILLHVLYVDDVNRERTTCEEEGEQQEGWGKGGWEG